MFGIVVGVAGDRLRLLGKALQCRSRVGHRKMQVDEIAEEEEEVVGKQEKNGYP